MLTMGMADNRPLDWERKWTQVLQETWSRSSKRERTRAAGASSFTLCLHRMTSWSRIQSAREIGGTCCGSLSRRWASGRRSLAAHSRSMAVQSGTSLRFRSPSCANHSLLQMGEMGQESPGRGVCCLSPMAHKHRRLCLRFRRRPCSHSTSPLMSGIVCRRKIWSPI